MAFEPAGVQFIAAGGDVYITTVNNATKATNTFVDATENGGGRVSGAGQVMIGALREVGKIATQAFLEAGKAAVSFVKDSIGVAGDFEQGMHKFQAVAGDAVDTKGLEKFKDLFISLGKELPVSTSEVEQAAIEMVSGGIDPAIVQAGALRSTIQFAAASGLSLADAAATSAKFLAGWTAASATTAEKVDFLTTSTDALTKAAAASSTTAAELRLGIFNVQGAAQALHAPFTDVVATLAELAPAFESSAQAGTALNVFMTRLEPQTKPAIGAMKELGIITKDNQNLFFDAQGGFLGMGNAAQVLKDKLSGLSDEQKISELHTLFGNDAMKVGNLLMQDGAAGIDAMKQKMDAANGVSATAALMQSGYNTALENAKGSVEALQIRIGSYLIPVLTDLLNNYIAPGINAITDFVQSIMSADDPLLALVQSIDSLAPGLGSIIGYIATLVTEGDAMNDFLTTTPALFQGVVVAVQDAIAEFSKLSSAFDTGGISGLIDQLIADIDAALPDIEAALAAWGQALIDWIAPMIPPALDALAALADAAWAWVKEQAPGWGAQLNVWGGELIDWIAPMIPPLLAALADLGRQFAGWIGDQASILLQRFLTWKTAFVAWIPGATVTFLAEWPKMFDHFLDWIGNEAGPLLKKLGDWALSFIQWIAPMIPPFLVALGGVALAIGAWVIETAAVLSKKITEKWIPAILTWIVTDAIPGLVKALDEFLKVFQGWIESAQRDLARWMIDVGTAIVDGIKEGIGNAWHSLTSWISDKVHSMVTAAMDAIGAHSPATEFMPVGSFAVQGIMAGFETMWPSLMSLVSDLGGNLTDQAQSIADSVQNAMADAFGATASIDRQKVSNLKAVADLSQRQQGGVQQQLNVVEQEARAMTDPQQAKEWFQLRSKQMIELAKLNDQIQATTDSRERDRLQAQYDLINAANQADISQFQAKAQSGGGMQDIINSINKLMQDTGLGIIQSPVLAQLAQLLDQLASPAATSGQMSGGSTTIYNQQTTNSMPIYTNNSPAALQQSWAVLQAGMV